MSREIKFRATSRVTSNIFYNYKSKPLWEFLRSVDGCLIEQFTGLKDKNGVDIYEGDVLSYYNIYSKKTYTQIVKWSKNFASFALFEEGSEWVKEFDWEAIRNKEVIGNIHENK